MTRWLLAALLLAGCATTSDLAGGVVIDQGQRIIWTEREDDARTLCWQRYGYRGAACAGADNVLILWRGASDALIDHEWCHRYGWTEDHALPRPRACETRPWRQP